MLSEEMSSLVPPGLQGKSDILFGNLHELYTFHNDIFLKDLENCISTTELVALCFVQRVRRPGPIDSGRITNVLQCFISARYVFPPLLVLLPKHTPV